MLASELQWLVTGAGGMLATDIERVLLARGARVRSMPKKAQKSDISPPSLGGSECQFHPAVFILQDDIILSIDMLLL